MTIKEQKKNTKNSASPQGHASHLGNIILQEQKRQYLKPITWQEL